MPANVVYSIAAQPNHPEPAYQTACRGQGYQSEPEPHKSKDLLVKQVDRQNTLNRVRVLASHAAQLEVAQGHARETYLGGQRSVTEYQVTHERHAVQVVLGAKKQVEYEQLDRQIQQVDCLHVHQAHSISGLCGFYPPNLKLKSVATPPSPLSGSSSPPFSNSSFPTLPLLGFFPFVAEVLLVKNRTK